MVVAVVIVILVIDVLIVTAIVDVVVPLSFCKQLSSLSSLTGNDIVTSGGYQRRLGYVFLADIVVLFVGVVVSTSSVVSVVDVGHLIIVNQRNHRPLSIL